MNSLPHLSEAEIDSVLIGAPAVETTTHLSQCGHCRQRVAEARVPITRFQAVTLSWSERQSATLPLRSSPARVMTWKRHTALAATATTALLIGLAIPLTKSELQVAPEAAGHRAGSSTATVSATALSTAIKQRSAVPEAGATDIADNEQDEQIARDNQMLQNIDQALDNPVESPADAYSLQPVDGHQQAATLTELN